MAPELWTQNQYQAYEADIFACGVILFLMRAKNIPFYEARDADPCYASFYTNDQSEFWAMHESNYQEGHFSEEFKDLITRML